MYRQHDCVGSGNAQLERHKTIGVRNNIPPLISLLCADGSKDRVAIPSFIDGTTPVVVALHYRQAFSDDGHDTSMFFSFFDKSRDGLRHIPASKTLQPVNFEYNIYVAIGVF